MALDGREIFPDAELERLIEGICKRPGMYVGDSTVWTVCAYIRGFDQGRSGGALVGLHQWLVLKCKGGDNVAWEYQAESLVRRQVGSAPSEDAAIAALGELLLEFIRYRRENGLTKIFYDYGKWLLRTSWYDGPLRPGGTKRSARSRKR